MDIKTESWSSYSLRDLGFHTDGQTDAEKDEQTDAQTERWTCLNISTQLMIKINTIYIFCGVCLASFRLSHAFSAGTKLEYQLSLTTATVDQALPHIYSR